MDLFLSESLTELSSLSKQLIKSFLVETTLLAVIVITDALFISVLESEISSLPSGKENYVHSFQLL
jgi:hypothetical protein